MRQNLPLAILAVATIMLLGACFLYVQYGQDGVATNEASAVICPTARNGKALSRAGVYDGPSSEHAILMPDTHDEVSIWDMSVPAVSPQGYFLVCAYGVVDEYGLSPNTIDIPLAEYQSCAPFVDAGGFNVVCSKNTGGSHAETASMSCPRMTDEGSLIESSIYVGMTTDGYDGYEIAPGEDGTYDLSEQVPNRDPYYLTCYYGGENYTQVKLPQSVTGCVYEGTLLVCS